MPAEDQITDLERSLLYSLQSVPNKLDELVAAVRKLEKSEIQSQTDSKRWEERHERFKESLAQITSALQAYEKNLQDTREHFALVCANTESTASDYTDKKVKEAEDRVYDYVRAVDNRARWLIVGAFSYTTIVFGISSTLFYFMLSNINQTLMVYSDRQITVADKLNELSTIHKYDLGGKLYGTKSFESP